MLLIILNIVGLKEILTFFDTSGNGLFACCFIFFNSVIFTSTPLESKLSLQIAEFVKKFDFNISVF